MGTYRDVELNRQHPLVETLGELTRERFLQRLRLQVLAQEDVARLIESTSGDTAHPGLIQAIHSQTEGNALFVTEIAQMLEQKKGLGTGATSASVQGEDRDSWTIREAMLAAAERTRAHIWHDRAMGCQCDLKQRQRGLADRQDLY